MLTFDQALTTIKQNTRRVATTESSPLHQCSGRFVAQDIKAPISMPPMENSAMDGYAINSADWAAHKAFPISLICAAGESPRKLEKNQTARIYTGAIIPQQADAVVPQELVEVKGNSVYFPQRVKPKQFIRSVGEDFSEGDVLVRHGDRLATPQILLLANAGIESLLTYKPLRIALFATGDEILPLGSTWHPGKIYDSNRPCLRSILENWGMNITQTQVIQDDYQKTKQTLLQAAKTCDIIITTGGVSVGDKDYIKPVLEEIGELTTWKVNIKPGKPIALGKIGTTDFIGLPGNPVSALNTLLLLGRPLLKKSQGAHERHINTLPWRIKSNFHYQTHDRQDFLRARLTLGENDNLNTATVTIFPRQQSHIVSSVSWADGLVSIPAQRNITPGDLVEYYSFNQLME